MSMLSPLCKLSSCPLLGEWSVVSKHYPPMTSLSISHGCSMERQGFTPAQVQGGCGYCGALDPFWDKLSRSLPFYS